MKGTVASQRIGQQRQEVGSLPYRAEPFAFDQARLDQPNCVPGWAELARRPSVEDFGIDPIAGQALLGSKRDGGGGPSLEGLQIATQLEQGQAPGQRIDEYQRVAERTRQRQPLLLARTCPVRLPQRPAGRGALIAVAHPWVMRAEGECMPAVPLLVVERPTTLAARLRRAILGAGAERDPFDMTGLEQQVRVALLLGHGHQPLGGHVGFAVFGSRIEDVPEIPFSDELLLGVAGLLAQITRSAVGCRQRCRSWAGDMNQGAPQCVLKRCLAPPSFGRVGKGQELDQRALEVGYCLFARGTGHCVAAGLLPELDREVGLAGGRQMVGHDLRRAIDLPLTQGRSDLGMNFLTWTAQQAGVGRVLDQCMLEGEGRDRR